jgi:cytidylate kinase
MTVLLDGEDVSKDIRDNQVSLAVSKVSSLKPVRDKLAECQKEFGKLKGVVMDGRDIGTVIFPEAELKIYMIASARERAKRRYEELKSKNSFQTVSLEELEEEIVNRDKQDSERAASPMKKADDAIELDTSNLSIEEQVEFILKRAKEYIEQN